MTSHWGEEEIKIQAQLQIVLNAMLAAASTGRVSYDIMVPFRAPWKTEGQENPPQAELQSVHIVYLEESECGLSPGA